MSHTSAVHPSLERVPGKQNWIDRLPGPLKRRWHRSWIYRAAKHMAAEGGMRVGRAIASAVNAAEKGCSTGDLNFPGKQSVNPKSRAEMCAGVAVWNAMKASTVSKSGRGLTDAELAKRVAPDILDGITKRISEEEFEELAKSIDDDFSSVEEMEDDEPGPLLVKGEISKIDEEKQIAFGWVSVGADKDGNVLVDKQGDFIDSPQDIEDAAYDFVLHSRVGGEMHVRKGVSTLVESFAATPEKMEKMGVPPGTLPTGWWCGFKFHDSNVWDGIKKGKYKEFSVHGVGKREEVD